MSRLSAKPTGFGSWKDVAPPHYGAVLPIRHVILVIKV